MNAPSFQDTQTKEPDRPDRLHRYRWLKQLLSFIPYSVGAFFLSIAVRNRLIQKVFRKHRQRLMAFLHENQLPVDLRDVFARYLITNWLTNWRLSALADCTDSNFDRWVSLEGYDYFCKLRAEGRPVLLCNSHYGGGKLILLALIRLGHRIHSLDRQDVFSFSNIRSSGELISINLGDRQSNFMLKQVFRARKVLQEGGILHIAGDGVRGLSGRAVPFFKRERHFPASVAELALATNAVILPVFSMIEVDGRVRLELLSPLDIPSEKLTHDERVMNIIEQYAALLHKHWREYPGAIHKGEIKIYSELPYRFPSCMI